jgi:site-specific recombinase XerD
MAGYLSSGPRELKGELARIERHVQEPNRKYLVDYGDFLGLNNRKERTAMKRLIELRTVCQLGVCNDFKNMTKAEVEEIVRRINRLERNNRLGQSLHMPLAAYSKARIRITFKAFVKWLLGDRANELVGWVKMDRAAGTSKLPDELLTEDDVEKLLNACRNQRDKALIALLWDAGARIGEVLNLRVKDVVMSASSPSYVLLDGKTGRRRTPLSVSVPFLARYINDMRRDAGADAPLFITIRLNTPTNNALDYTNVKMLFEDLKGRSNLNKRLHSHLFRYSRCTFLATHGMSSVALERFFGWKNTKMPDHYSRLSGQQVDSEFFSAVGMKEEGEPEKPKLVSRPCYKCHVNNEATAKCCINCGSPLDKSPTEQLDEMETLRSELDKTKEAMAETQQNLEVLMKKLGFNPRTPLKTVLEL